MVGEFVCVLCGKKFTREWSGHGGNRARFCDACRADRKRASDHRNNVKWNAERKRQRAEAKKTVEASKIVRRCRRCGKVFEQYAKPGLYSISAHSDAYVLRSYCKSCAWAMKRAARACDSRYVGVGGHGDVLEYRTVRGEA